MRLLHSSDDATFFQKRIDVPASFSAFVMRITGTNTGAALAMNEIGRIQYMKRGKMPVDVDWHILLKLNKLWNKTLEFASAAGPGGAMASTVFIPRFFIEPNIERVDPSDNATFQIDFLGPVSTKMTGFLAELYIIPDEGLNVYDLNIKQFENTYGGAGLFTQPIAHVENIAGAYLTDVQTDATGSMADASTAIDRILANIGDFSLNATTQAALAMTRLRNGPYHEALPGYQDHVEVFSAEVGEITARLADEIDLKIETSGAAHPVITLLGMEFNPNKLADTSVIVASSYDRIERTKKRENKFRTIATFKQMGGIAQDLKPKS